MHSFKHRESNFWWSFLSIKAYQPFLLGCLARSYFWKSTWKIDPNFHIYQHSHFVTLHVTENAIYSWNMMSIVFTERNRCFFQDTLVTRLWSTLGDLSEQKWQSWSLKDLFDSNWKFKQFALNPSACLEFIHINSFD